MTPTPDWVKQLKPSGVQGHELLKAERENSNVPVQELQVLLHTQDVIDRRESILKILKAEKVFDKSQNYFMGRIDKFERALAREKRLRMLKKQHNWTKEEFHTAADLVGEPGPYGLHDSMFKVCVILHFANGTLIRAGYTRGSGHTRAAGKVAHKGQRVQNHWMLCSD